ncbi:flagellar biosynthesis repressor FlbT [Brytella acorum]|uniref:Flagellar biosynthesis repressor FlbT n=1 Tax=Brytella acorum TaxID=2959299 RepID=A0AA35XX84_9PROT|nr:flagellar biosynthesis repressor FlbT [Brytella acorum]MDF3625761.1 flagellar biosynthesis repressor FlbT [Brytella acorum]CAI9121647.1 flagellar biosynthesis repressor FlbT [Brytella acorum]
MAGLGIRLAAGDKLVVNGAAIQFETDARITFVNHVNFLFGRQILAPDEAVTPARRIYFALQTAYVGTPEERCEALKSAEYFITAFAAETTSTYARALLTDALHAARDGRGYDALRFARRIIRHEDAVLAPRISDPAV